MHTPYLTRIVIFLNKISSCDLADHLNICHQWRIQDFMLGGAKNKKVRSKKKTPLVQKFGENWIFFGYFFKMFIKFTNLFCYFVNFINILKK